MRYSLLKAIMISGLVLLGVSSSYGQNRALVVKDWYFSRLHKSPTLDSILTCNNFVPTYSDTVYPDMDSFSIVLWDSYSASNPTSANYLKEYVEAGGGLITCSGNPFYLCGKDTCLGHISEWFGAKKYWNVSGNSHLLVDYPFDSELESGTILAQSECGIFTGTVFYPSPEAQVIARWSCDENSIFAFYHTYGQGRVYYSAVLTFWKDVTTQNITTTDNLLVLLESVLRWSAGYLNGDFTGDWRVDLSDVVHLANFLLKTEKSPPTFSSGDVNGDGKLNASDIVYLINYVSRDGSPPVKGRMNQFYNDL